MARFPLIPFCLSLSIALFLFPCCVSTQLRQNYYANVCPNVEQIARNAITQKLCQTFVTVPATIRLFFHDCFVNGCDASVIVASSGGNTAEKDHPDNLSLAGDGFDTVIKAKAAVDSVPSCRNKVSCANILAMATRDVIVLAGGPSYAVELGRLDGPSSTASSVNGRLPQPSFNLAQLNTFVCRQWLLSQTDMIALSEEEIVTGITKRRQKCLWFSPSPSPSTPSRQPAVVATAPAHRRRPCRRRRKPVLAQIRFDPVNSFSISR